TRSRNGKESLLIVQLAASFATLASRHPAARLCPSAVASGTILVAENLDLRFDAGRCFLKRQREVVAQVCTTLAAPAARALTAVASENVAHAKQVAENVLKIFEDRGIEPAEAARLLDAGVAVAVVELALLRVRKNAIGLGRGAELLLRFLFVLRIPVRVPLQRGFAVCGFYLVLLRVARNTQDLVVVTF